MIQSQPFALPLTGIKVIDATSNIAGPFGGAILADLGAEVLKLESPQGDPSRNMVPLDGDRSAYFHITNRNKKVTTLDFKTEEGQDKFSKLLEGYDVFLTNFLPDNLSKLHLEPSTLMNKFPQLIYGNLSSYGSIGLDANRAGYDATVQARTGIMAITGETNSSPVRTGVSVLDMGSGTWLALGVLAALVKRERTGKGSLIETSLYETGVSWVSYHLASFQISGQPSNRYGAAHPTFSPYDLYEASDGQVCIGVGSDQVFNKLMNALGRLELIKDERFLSNKARVDNRNILNEEINNCTRKNTVQYWVKILGEAGVPADAVVLPEKLLNDPQAQALNMLLKNPDSTALVEKIPGLPIRINGERPPIRNSAPHQESDS